MMSMDGELMMSSRSRSEDLEMITAANTLVLLSRDARRIHSSTFFNRSSKPCKKPRRSTSIHDDVLESSSRSRNKRATCRDELPSKKRRTCLPATINDDDGGVKNTISTTKKKKKKKNVRQSAAADQGPSPPPDMPGNVKSVIDAMGGTGLVLMVQKRLTATDVSHHQNRLQIPFSQIINSDFLTEGEKHYLSTRDEKNNKCNHIDIPLLDPELKLQNIHLRRWLMAKSSGAMSCEVYAITNSWIDIARKNRLREGSVVQVWGFRVGDRLHLALLKLA